MDDAATRTPWPPPATRNDLPTQRETGNRNITCGHDSFQVPGLGPQVSGSGIQHLVQVQDPHPYPYLITRARYLTAETRDPKMFSPRHPPLEAATRHLKCCLSLLHLCTGAALRFALLHGLCLRPTCPLLALCACAHSPVTIFNRYCALFQSPTIWA